MNKITGLFIVQCLFLASYAEGAPEKASEESPDVSVTESQIDFQSCITANHVTEMIRKQLISSFMDDTGNRKERAAEGAEGNEEDTFPRPEFHYSTLRAEASGSAIPSPTMFVGGFSFMMMPTPEGEQVFNKIMSSMPNLPGGRK